MFGLFAIDHFGRDLSRAIDACSTPQPVCARKSGRTGIMVGPVIDGTATNGFLNTSKSARMNHDLPFKEPMCRKKGFSFRRRFLRM